MLSFQWLRESSEPMHQVVPVDTSFKAHTEEISLKHSVSSAGEPHTQCNNGGTPSESLNHCNNGGTPSEYLKSETLSTTPKAVPSPYELASQERDSALLRYKQKKKTRRYVVVTPYLNSILQDIEYMNTFFRMIIHLIYS
jgi:hypothetical protein